ncbi:hypothetical protein CULT_490021 [[Clostridium] ultunense Esp]|nr:hypothetical protein CULT_490021 [[Clostridium] ultunense Esp]
MIMVPKYIIVEINLFPLIMFIPSIKSILNAFALISSGFLCFLGILINISLIADNKKLRELIVITIFKPKLPYIIAPSTGANNWPRFITNELKEFASSKSSFSTILGITADMAEPKNISVISKSITKIYIIGKVKLPLMVKITAYIPIMMKFSRSNNTIVLFLSNQSPKTPAIGDSNSLGRIEIDRMDANMVAEPVNESTYKDRANCCILLPSKDTNFPNINRKKSFCLISFVFII